MITARLSLCDTRHPQSFRTISRRIGVAWIILAAMASLAGPALADGPALKFAVRGAAELKAWSGRIEKVEFSGYTAPKDIGEEIAKAPHDLSCEEAADDGKPAPVTLTVSKVPSFDLRGGSAYNCVISKAKKQGVTFRIKTEVGGTGVTG
ncbi:MAG: hypothetical protein AB7O49_15820 [Sphingomonadales bacterium]